MEQTAASEETCRRIRRISAIHRAFEHRGETFILRGQQVLSCPLGNRIVILVSNFMQALVRQLQIRIAQLADDFQITDQGAQFGGGTQIQFGALVDVERLV